MKINVLKSEVYSQIAAGEVVEKPFNVVKELVENSIDAGATEIKIEIENGGIDLIRVTDNGCGIDRSEVSNAFAPHATSKLQTIEDLQKILTLGFRGEALSSIASVSKINLKTKTEIDEFGTEVQNNAGNIVSLNDVGLFKGTVFEVRDLFFNIPARKKFLKKPKLEESDITEFVEKLILSHPEISFNYFVNSKQVYNFKGSDLKNAIFTIYGKEVLNNLIPVESSLSSLNSTISGFVGKPAIAKGNKKDQTLFINGRFVKNQTVYSAIGRVFENYLMKGKYAFYVLNLSIPSENLDVNVHPTKQEVRFTNTSEIFSFVYQSVSKALLNASRLNLDDALDNEDIVYKIDDKKFSKPSVGIENTTLKNESSFFDLFKQNNKNEDIYVAKDNEILSDIILPQNKTMVSVPLQNNQQQIEEKKEAIFSNEYRIIGTAFKTYIIVEEGDNLHFIDQHATHERLLFDKLTGKTNNVENQPKQQLLIPYVANLNYSQNEIMQENLESLKNIGLCFEEFGKNTYKLNEVPLFLKDLNYREFLNEMFNSKEFVSNIKSSDIVRNKLATIACKSAIKAGDTLQEDEIRTLINEVKEKNTVLLCPHGRPIVITYSKKDLEKWFKRIV